MVDKVQRLPKDGGTRHHPQLLEIETQQFFMMLGTGGGKAAEKVPRFQAGDTVRQRMDTVEDTVAHRFLVGDKSVTSGKHTGKHSGRQSARQGPRFQMEDSATRSGRGQGRRHSAIHRGKWETSWETKWETQGDKVQWFPDPAHT